MRLALMAIATTCAGPALAQDFLLQSPIDCDLNGPCYVQQYVDHDPGDGARDFMCRGLSYDTHKGTDFALPSAAMMQRGVPVLASADGVVGGVRDGMKDGAYSRKNADAVAGRECGNGVRLTHENGWSTQYCHLREGSLTVKQGQSVRTGDILGLVGQSGRAEFPHVHFVVRKDGALIDPFDPDGEVTCATPGDSSLWAERPAYRPGGLISAGFSDRVPEYSDIRAGTANNDALTTNAPALVIWGYAFGSQKGDVFRLSLAGPAGDIITRDITLEKGQAQLFRAIGRKRRGDSWPAGTYTGTTSLMRDGKTLETRTITTTLR